MNQFSTYKCYPFGMLMPGRHEQENTYEYGFNGMRKDDEIKGESGTSYDFGARMYDPRVGRWMSTDGHEYKYPGISTYNYAMNNPNIFKDADGNDGILTVDKENKTVTLETTVYLYGVSKEYGEKLAKDFNTAFAALQNSAKVVDKDDPNTIWTVTINIKYEYDKTIANGLEAQNINSTDFLVPDGSIPAGSNALCLGGAMGRTDGQAPQGANNGYSIPFGKFAIHETFHFIGFDERYHKGAGAPIVGFERDVLSNGQPLGIPQEIMKFHFVDVLDYATSQFPLNGTFTLGYRPCEETIQVNEYIDDDGVLQKGTLGPIGRTIQSPTLFMIDNTQGGDLINNAERERIKVAESRVVDED